MRSGCSTSRASPGSASRWTSTASRSSRSTKRRTMSRISPIPSTASLSSRSPPVSSCRDRFRPTGSRDPVPIGVSGGLSGVATGTLGARVTDGTNVYILSNNHVLAGVNTASIGDPIIQPGDADGGHDPGDRVATLAAYQTINFSGGTNTMDAAIALTSTANVGHSDAGRRLRSAKPVTAPAAIGQAVQKYGRTTGLQQGNVAATNVSVDVCYVALIDFCLQEARFAGQFSISPGPFSAPGDSGSLVVTQGANQPVGLLFAGGDGLTIATPIDLVLQRFGVTIDGTAAGPGPPVRADRALGAFARRRRARSLSWTPPAFDGGSPVTDYKVYRGTSPGAEPFHANAGDVDDASWTPGSRTGRPTTTRCPPRTRTAKGQLSNEASATPTDLVPPLDAAADRRRLQPREREPAVGRRALDERHHARPASRRASSSPRTRSPARRRRPAPRGASQRQYGPDVEVWTTISTLPGAGNAVRLLRPPAAAGHADLRRLHAAHEPARGHRPGLPRAHRQRAIVSRLTVNQELAAGDVAPPACEGLDPRGLAQRQARPGRGSASSWTRRTPLSGFAGVGLRGHDRAPRRLRGAEPRRRAQPARAHRVSAPSAERSSVSLSWTAPAFDGGSPITDYRVYRGTSAGPRASTPTPDRRHELRRHGRCQRHDLLLQGVRRER